MKTTATHSDPSLRLMHFTKIALLAAVVVGGIGEASPALANGGKSMDVVLGASESDGITFETAVEWATFLLNTAGDKYMLIRLTVKNNSAKPLLLSSTYDAIEVYFGNKKVKGILDLSRQDPALWQALNPKMRKLVAFPASVPPGDENSIIVYIPKIKSPQVLDHIRYKINSLTREIVLKPEIVSKG